MSNTDLAAVGSKGRRYSVPFPAEELPHFPSSGRVEDVQRNASRMTSSINDLKSRDFWKAVSAEFVGTFILVLTALGSVTQDWSMQFDILHVAICFGLSVATSVWIIGHVSGGHINPAVSLAMLVARRISLLRFIIFTIAQCVAAIFAAAILQYIVPSSLEGSLGATTLNPELSACQGMLVELLITFTLVMTVFATCDSDRKDHGGSGALSIGIAVLIGHLFAVRFTGSSMNPARSFGPAVIMNIWSDHWIYWAGPMLGGVVAAILYDTWLATNASLKKTRDLIMASTFDNSHYQAA